MCILAHNIIGAKSPERGYIMNKQFTTTNNAHNFSVTVNTARPGAEEWHTIIDAIENGVKHEPLASREDFTAFVVGEVNAMIKTLAIEAVMFSADVLSVLCGGVTYGKITLEKDGDAITLNGGTSGRYIAAGKVDKETLYDFRPDYILYSDVAKAFKRYTREKKKAGDKTAYTLAGDIPFEYSKMLTVFAHNLSDRLSAEDVAKVEKAGKKFAAFAATSTAKRLEAVQAFYALFNSRTGAEHKAIEFIVKSLRKDKRLATFDSMHYTDTVPGECAVLDVLIMHYVNTGKAVHNKSRAKSIGEAFAEVKADK